MAEIVTMGGSEVASAQNGFSDSGQRRGYFNVRIYATVLFILVYYIERSSCVINYMVC